MTKAKREEYEARLARKIRVTMPQARSRDVAAAASLLFRATRASLSASIPGEQKKRIPAKELDATYALIFPAIIRAV